VQYVEAPNVNAIPEIILPKTVSAETVLDVKHWTDDLFSFRLTRPTSFRFRSGEFVMLGLMDVERPLLRAYSIASPSWDDGLDFYSIKVPNGPLTSRLQNIQPGDDVLLAKKPTGTLVLDALKPGKRLFLFSTGTGFAPFASLLREPETYEKFEQVIVTQTCRHAKDLAFASERYDALAYDPLVDEIAAGRVELYTSVTREDFIRTGRITDLISSKKIFGDLNIAEMHQGSDRAMICGSNEMIRDTKNLLEALGFDEGSNASPGDYVVEKAFAG